ncbi:MAG: TerC family protein [Ignavibacteriae bacterium]|nr:TerC family protein [Ignavibacteriota bacterium]
MQIGLWHWGGFVLFLVIMLALDLGVFNKKQHEVNVKEALITSGIWIALAIVFNVGVFYLMGHDKGLEFLTGYLLEKSLSVDNIFVFILLFSFFDVPKKYQHKVLFWGIFGALIMRAILIFIGTALIAQFSWVIIIFGAFLVIAGLKMAFQKEGKVEPNKNPVVKFVKKIIPVTPEYHKDKFFVRMKKGGLFATPLFIVLIVVETTDLIFAFDSIPAILAITNDTFIVFTSNAFAILGLRALYFALSGFMDKFHYLKMGLSIILVFIGIKMLIAGVVHISTVLSLVVILFVLTIAIGASMVKNKRTSRALEK